MTFINAFQELANTYNGSFHHERTRQKVIGGQIFYIDLYSLKIPCSASEIDIQYEFGNHNMAMINCMLPAQAKNANFKLTTTSNYFRLFNKNLNPFKIKTTNNQLENFFKQNEHLYQLSCYAQNESFTPEFTGQSIDNHFQLECHFYLGFENKMTVLSPLIQFFFQLISFINNQLLRYK